MFDDLVTSFVDDIFEERRSYYAKNPKRRPSPAGVESIIRRCTNSAGRWSFFFNLFWGPLGVLAIFPEIRTVLKRQFEMVYDLSVAHGKEGQLPRNLALDIVLGGAKGLGMGLMVAHGGKLIVKRSSLRVLQSLAKVFAAKLTQRAIKGYLLGKILPFLGPFLMRFWSRHTTRVIGRRAVEVLVKPIEVIDDESVPQLESVIQ